ncbi:hypothetical protein C5473_18915 [Leptospira interrogans serovar Weerasinghe]|nr:hypothetical protein C5473_18915 [Leptospira interrogans serovar Weerasinghe]
MFPKLRRIFSSSFHSHLLPLFLEKKVSTFMLLGQRKESGVPFLVFCFPVTLPILANADGFLYLK